MIFLPYSTDAPIYHWPVATVSIIAANVVIFFVTTLQVALGNLEPESIEWLMLEFDQINPLQWITGAFMHGDIMHLLGNMLFLWAFGLVIEGKVGSVVFTGMYFLITLLDGASGQIPMFLLGSDGSALGASGVIFALMMIAVIWAPENEMDCFYWIVVVIGTTEVRIVALGVAFVFLQLVFLFLNGFSMSSELLHLVGAAIGAPIGFYMLRQGMVDCEGWDIVSRSFLRKNPLFATPAQRKRIQQGDDDEILDPVAEALNQSSKTPRSQTAATPAAIATQASKQARKGPKKTAPTAVVESSVNVAEHPEFNRLSFILRQAVQAKNGATAMQTFHRLDQLELTSGLSSRTLFQYVGLLGGEHKYTEALRPLGLIVGRGGAEADQARLRIAMIQIKVLKKPQLAVSVLQAIAEDSETDPAILNKRDQLLAQVKSS